MKVRFIKSHPRYGYFAGQEGEIEDPIELLNGGYVEPVQEETQTATLPKAETAAKETATKKTSKKK